MSEPVEKLKAFYSELRAERLPELGEIYAEQVQFRDPLHHIEGVNALQHYLHNMLGNVAECRFEYLETDTLPGKAYIKWHLYFRQARLNQGQEICVRGVSELHFDDKVFYHEDFFDAGAMLYEQLPLLRSLIAWLKGRLEPAS